MPQDTLSKEIFHPRDINSQEQRIRIALGNSAKPSEPILINTLVNEKETLTVLWLSEIDDQKYLFPISKPNCKEFEHSNLSEWNVIFLGSFEQMIATELTRLFENVSAGPDNGIFCLLTVNHRMIGFDGKDMSCSVFPSCVVSRVEQGKLITPKMFCEKFWQPVRNPLMLGNPIRLHD